MKIITPQQKQQQPELPKKLFMPVLVIPVNMNAINSFVAQHFDGLFGFLPAYFNEEKVKTFKVQYLTLNATFTPKVVKKIETPTVGETVVDRMKALEEEIKKHEGNHGSE